MERTREAKERPTRQGYLSNDWLEDDTQHLHSLAPSIYSVDVAETQRTIAWYSLGARTRVCCCVLLCLVPMRRLGTATLHFPCHLVFLSPGKLSKYSLASKQAGCCVSLPPINGSGAPHEAKQLVHSPKQHAWLVFFENRAAVGPAAAAAASGAASRAASPAVSEPGGRGGGGAGGCHFTLVHDAAAAAQAAWFLPGGFL